VNPTHTTASLLGATVIYVLSIGPVVMMFEHRWISSDLLPTLQVIYKPLEWVCTGNDAEKYIQAYVDWWTNTFPVSAP